MLCMKSHLVYLSLFISCLLSCQEMETPSDFKMPGDHIIAGLFPIHSVLEEVKGRPEVPLCERSEAFNGHGYHLFQAMRYAIEEINNSSSLLPNITLGYELYDVCSKSANVYATLSILSQPRSNHVQIPENFFSYYPKAVAVIGPSSSEMTSVTATLLSALLIPQISYAASSMTFSEKQQYPSFLRMIPSDKLQVQTIVMLLKEFGWSWISVIGSDNDYGLQGVQMLEEFITEEDICIAHKDVVPISAQAHDSAMQDMILSLTKFGAEVVVVFCTRNQAHIFFEAVLLGNVTDKVWIATEDWSISSYITQVPGISRIGTVIGVAIPQREILGIKEFEKAYTQAKKTSEPSAEPAQDGHHQICNQHLSFTTDIDTEMSTFSMNSAYNAYAAVYAVAHGLHQLLGCPSGVCTKGKIYPWQLLEEVKKVDFMLHGNPVSFNENGDPLSGYDIIAWDWNGPNWTFKIIGASTWFPVHMEIDGTKIRWHRGKKQVPRSVCSEECPAGEARSVVGLHHCCFECVPCPAGTFVNSSDQYVCHRCKKEEWSPVGSQMCFNRTTQFLAWHHPVSLVLMGANTLLLLLLAGVASLFAQHLNTPVVRSAGGRMCFLMLGSLAGAGCSPYCFFGEPTPLTCLLRQSLFALGFAIFLSCLTIRSFQLVVIFKLSAKMPTLYRSWVQNHGPKIFVVMSSTIQLLICITWLVAWTPKPTKEYKRFPELVVLECSKGASPGYLLSILYTWLLSVSCFACSYVGKDLPENYNEAKCITFSLLLYFISWIGLATASTVYYGKYLPAINALVILSSLGGVFSGYFLPKCYVILCRPDLNTTEYFQASIQDYTQRCSSP
ncbi:taste receptor type 1 member 1 [Trichosurus vulpecula]|uniref:taste receptor type 1 member 1 n=1 Tax=Trichosurus vulpecula TaxID=9337 RepID=UPI00186AFCB1|nr:taste receptor type 1 member 1 [Trichosurus vulpecula]